MGKKIEEISLEGHPYEGPFDWNTPNLGYIQEDNLLGKTECLRKKLNELIVAFNALEEKRK